MKASSALVRGMGRITRWARLLRDEAAELRAKARRVREVHTKLELLMLARALNRAANVLETKSVRKRKRA